MALDVLVPSERADFLGPNESLGDSLNTIPEQFIAMRLTGTMKDAAGTTGGVLLVRRA
jgi:hypothetical protein